ncbi:MAG TPA: hypothetical protein VN948_04915 [Terriglobales bacterium]|nr:hypothetical protein [Terriglobales bacterium]
MNSVGKILALLVCCIPMVACLGAGHKRNAKWEKDFTYIKMIRADLSESSKLNFDCSDYKVSSTKLNWVQQAQCYMEDSANSKEQKAAFRNWIVERFITFVNHAFGDFEHDSVLLRSTTATAFDYINLGLAAATTVTGMATTLGAASTGTQGASHSFNKNYYNDQTAFVINSKMEALRLEQLSKIREREVLPVDCPANQQAPAPNKGSQELCYTLEQAMNDVQELYYAGTVHRALQDINNQTSAQATRAETKLKTLNSEPIK